MEDLIVRELRKDILLSALSFDMINSVQIKNLCDEKGVNEDVIYRSICPYLDKYDGSVGSTRHYRLNHEGKLFIAGGFWDRIEAEKERHDLEIKNLKKSNKYAAPAFWISVVSIAIASLLAIFKICETIW